MDGFLYSLWRSQGPDIPSCHSHNLSGSLFLFSSKHNVLLAGYCGGGVVMVDKDDHMVAGCAAVCINGTEVTKNCYDIGCCKTTIPFCLGYYGFKFLGLKVKDLSLIHI